MKAIQYTRIGAEPELTEIPKPEPGPGEVLLEVTAAGVCHSDDFIMSLPEEQYTYGLPLTLGHEGAGRVAAVGEGVEGLDIGTNVVVYGLGLWQLLALLARTRKLLFSSKRTRHQSSWSRCTRRVGRIHDRRFTSPPRPDRRPRSGQDGAADRRRSDSVSRDQAFTAETSRWLVRRRHRYRRSRPCRHPTPPPPLGSNRHRTRRERGQARTGNQGGRSRSGSVRQGRGRERPQDHRKSGRRTGSRLRRLSATIDTAMAVAGVGSDVTIVGIGDGQAHAKVGFFQSPYEASVTVPYWGARNELIELIDLAHAGIFDIAVETFSLDNGAEAYRRLAAGTLSGRAVVVPGL